MPSNEPDVTDDLNQADQVEGVQVDYSHIAFMCNPMIYKNIF